MTKKIDPPVEIPATHVVTQKAYDKVVRYLQDCHKGLYGGLIQSQKLKSKELLDLLGEPLK